MPYSVKPLRYIYQHTQTEATTGYFTCVPVPEPSAQEILLLIAHSPLDSFLRRYALQQFLSKKIPEQQQLMQEFIAANPASAQIIQNFENELMQIRQQEKFVGQELADKTASPLSPLLYIRQASVTDTALQHKWIDLFNGNIQKHNRLPTPKDTSLPLPYTLAEIQNGKSATISLQALLAGLNLNLAAATAPEAKQLQNLADLALQRLKTAGVVNKTENRHIASLSPIGLQLEWKLYSETNCGHNQFTLQGTPSSYGRGLTLEQAYCSCRMEVVERYSAYVSVSRGQILDRKQACPIHKSSLSELKAQNINALDPNSCYLEAPYNNEQIYWMSAKQVQRTALSLCQYEDILVPVQLVTLFSNLDEIDLCSASGSTGLATGTTQEQAQLAALLEIMERDAEATTPYNKARCFTIAADSENIQVQKLFASYTHLGINVQFMDMTSSFGLPCYQCFVIGKKGEIYRGHGAGLTAENALISALTETPYPYPQGGSSGPLLRNLPVKKISALPNYSTKNTQTDLALLELLLCKNGFNPIYADLTQASLQFPVSRALVPGLMPFADFDGFSRLSVNLFKNYLRDHPSS